MKRLLFLLFIVFCFEVSAQKWEIEAGLSFPDLIHVGIKREISEVNKIGFSIGSFPKVARLETFPLSFTLHHELTIDYAMKDPSRPTFYTAQRLTYLSFEDDEVASAGLFLSILLGRHFRINEIMGINADAGMCFTVDEWHQSKKPDVLRYSFGGIAPAFGINWYWKLPAKGHQK